MKSEFQHISDKASQLLKLRERALMLGWNKSDNEVMNAWWNLNRKIDSTYYNMDSPSIYDKDLQELTDQVEDLIGRTTQADKEDLK